ncbi:Hypothetical protein P9303_12691 [Prochlorococcus marinus str. MIT 9303]|uniref:Uncharacterized protein n=1 Tax=Prochlorococcus marinus (strain MIT 9303) TaxID=59922 RepID=A2C956_PROM3|nr:Hypothetical protein P9303_12691 [Prochlorococcus marinus str. MIT 9303]KZR66293.1 hypothetical protein PMIT1306_00239 [Prochlorococcus sp. MIT 1306]
MRSAAPPDLAGLFVVADSFKKAEVRVQGSLLNEWRGPLVAIASLMSLLPAATLMATTNS